MKTEVQKFLTAVMFYTRIPVPESINHSEDLLRQSRKYFPLIGWFSGLAGALTFGLGLVVFPLEIAVVFSMLAGIILTGAIHEDGLADCCDAFGGGWSKEQVLKIMKDSRVGTFGLTGLFFTLLIKFLCLFWLSKQLLMASAGGDVLHSAVDFGILLIGGHSISRFVALTFIYTHKYSRIEQSKSEGVAGSRLTIKEIIFAGLTSIVPVFFLQKWELIFLIIPLYLIKWLIGKYFHKRIGGFTGDCIGATQQLIELSFYLGVIVVWKFT